MELINNFGIDPILLGAQIVNFLIVLLILRKFLYKPILDTLKNRRDKISDGLLLTEEARVRLEKIEKDEKNILKNAKDEGKKLIDDAKKEATEMIQKAQFEAKMQAERLIGEAKLQINLEAKETEKKLANNISRLAIELIEKSSLELFGKKEQEIVMKNALNKFKKKAN